MNLKPFVEDEICSFYIHIEFFYHTIAQYDLYLLLMMEDGLHLNFEGVRKLRQFLVNTVAHLK